MYSSIFRHLCHYFGFKKNFINGYNRFSYYSNILDSFSIILFSFCKNSDYVPCEYYLFNYWFNNLNSCDPKYAPICHTIKNCF